MLTPRRRLLEEIKCCCSASQKNFPPFTDPQWFSTEFTRVSHWFLSWVTALRKSKIVDVTNMEYSLN
jgi:hypothetical protein